MNEFLEIGHLNIVKTSAKGKNPIVVDIDYKGVHFSKLQQISEDLMIQLYPNFKDEYWEFDCFEILRVLQESKNRIVIIKDNREKSLTFSQGSKLKSLMLWELISNWFKK